MSKRSFVDLHTHSTASDGSLPPAEVVRLADQAHLAAVALTDHDTVAGIDEARLAAEDLPELLFVPGIEISAAFAQGTLHILGLGIDPASPCLAQMMATLQDARATRNPRILRKLADMGMPLSMTDVATAADELEKGGLTRPYGRPQGRISDGGSLSDRVPSESARPIAADNAPANSGLSPFSPFSRILGRVHIALAMIGKGYVKTTQEAFDRYIGSGKPAYVDKERLSPREAIQGIHDSGGLAVLAHPPQLLYENDAQLTRILREFIQAGLDGIEAFHPDNNLQQTRLYVDLARRFDLGITGGSDFHGAGKPSVLLGKPTVPIEALGERFADKLLGK